MNEENEYVLLIDITEMIQKRLTAIRKVQNSKKGNPERLKGAKFVLKDLLHEIYGKRSVGKI